MVFNCTQDICSSFNITCVWSAPLVPGGRGEGEREEKKKCRGRLWLLKKATLGPEIGPHGCLSRFCLSHGPDQVPLLPGSLHRSLLYPGTEHQ